MKCRCVAEHCTQEASETGLCEACQLCHDLNGDCALPTPPQAAPAPLDAEVVQSQKSIDAALDAAAESAFGI